ncbi:hypothetical protein GCM10022254_41450 [Actinomadura meridiana]|uniref:Response regulatory domain-containing protein n=1 Tax=Actinomadura meridiana TaxID=559626 RepID=A0ABP8C883_9ACTN
MTPRVLLADDHPVYRDGLRLMLESTGEVEVVGTAPDGTVAVEMAGRLRPDVVVMDLRMPRLGGVDATRRILAARPETGVLVLTMHEDDESVFAKLQVANRAEAILRARDAGLAP